MSTVRESLTSLLTLLLRLLSYWSFSYFVTASGKLFLSKLWSLSFCACNFLLHPTTGVHGGFGRNERVAWSLGCFSKLRSTIPKPQNCRALWIMLHRFPAFSPAFHRCTLYPHTSNSTVSFDLVMFYCISLTGLNLTSGICIFSQTWSRMSPPEKNPNRFSVFFSLRKIRDAHMLILVFVYQTEDGGKGKLVRPISLPARLH